MIDFCKIKEIQKALLQLEENFKTQYGISINEASVLCSLSNCCLTSSEIAQCADLKASHTSKTIRSVEDKKLIMRKIGTIDKRMMQFSLTKDGQFLLKNIKNDSQPMPEILQTILDIKSVTINL